MIRPRKRALPIAAITNIAVALNVLQLASFFIAFYGMYCLARHMISRPTACLIALLYLLWGGRWMRLSGQLNVLLASALIPWLILFLERTITSDRRWPRWAVATALVWALAISVSLYFIWVGIFIFAGWLLGGVIFRRITLKGAILRMAVISGLALLLCSPYLYLYWRGQMNTVSYEIWHINSWSLSLNWLPSFYPSHSIPILRDIARWQVNDIFLESSHVGFGVVILVMAALGLTARGRRPAQWGGILLTIAIGIILALGPTLHWGGKVVSLDIMQPINKLIWNIGHNLKPDIFVEQIIRSDFALAIPLPGLILSATVPFFEGARVPARFMLLAAPGILLLAGIGLERIPKPWLKMVIMALLLVESSRLPIKGVPFPPTSHPVFTWLAGRSVPPGESVLDVMAISPDIQIPYLGGPTLWATEFHHLPIASGGGSMLPTHTDYLIDWFATHPDLVNEDDFPWLLRGYGIRYVLLHMGNTPTEPMSRLATGTADLKAVGCFEAVSGPPWDYPICVLEVTPPVSPAINVHMAGNWPEAEEWGIWAMGRKSRIRWISTNGKEDHFVIEAFPHCIEGQPQQMLK